MESASKSMSPQQRAEIMNQIGDIIARFKSPGLTFDQIRALLETWSALERSLVGLDSRPALD